MEAKLHKKRKDDVHHALLYDIGSTSATASLVRVSVSTKTKGRKMSVVETVDVKAVAWSSFLGGRSFDRRLSGLLAERYNSLQAELGATSFDVRDDPRAMATLLREAARTKEKLSANKELAVSVEGLPSNVAVRAPVALCVLALCVTFSFQLMSQYRNCCRNLVISRQW
jgi:molecular chaperone DnaK (HSP70)